MDGLCDPCDGYPMVELDSDTGECASSSEDEIDVILHGTMKQKRALRRRSLGQKSSSDDEFEKEMDAELNQRMDHIAAAQSTSTREKQDSNLGDSTKTSKPKVDKNKSVAEEFNDSFSDNEDDGKETKGTTGPSNDDLLYDPDLDDVDQQWVDKQRSSYQVRSSGGNHQKPASSDSVLCCPACMVVLCRDCQRHSLYKNQFRAMFVMNCSVDETEVLRYPAPKKHNKKAKKSKKASQLSDANETSREETAEDTSSCSTSDNDKYHAVHCTGCSTHVALYDSDEVYHFFNVIDGNG